MPKKDLRSSFQEQLNAAGRVAPVEEIEAIADSSGLLAYTGVSAVSSATATASTLLSGRYAYDPDEVIWEDAGKVHDNPWQTRSDGYADPAQLEDLIESFNAKGQLQPFVVRPHPDQVLHPGEFQQAFGHRRKYTVKVGKANAGTGRPDARNLIGKVPFVVRAMTDSDMVEAVIDENENRENPKPMDQARGYSNLQLVVSNEMADEGLIRRLPNRKLERLAAWREVANRRQRKYRTLARGASLMQLPKEIRDQFDEPGNWGFLTQAHGLGLLTLQDHPQDQKRLLHDAIQAGWSGAEVTIQAKERLRDIDTRRGQTTIEGTEEAAKTKAEPKRESSGSSSGASGGGSSPSGARLSLVPSTAPADSTTGQTSDAAPETTSDASTNSELLEAAEPESRNDSLAKKARSFIEAAFNELGQIDADGYDLEDIGWAQEHLKRALGSLKLAKNELSAAN